MRILISISAGFVAGHVRMRSVCGVRCSANRELLERRAVLRLPVLGLPVDLLPVFVLCVGVATVMTLTPSAIPLSVARSDCPLVVPLSSAVRLVARVVHMFLAMM